MAWGPLCFTVVALIIMNHPLRHPLQILLSVGHMYSDILYYSTALIDKFILNVSYSRPEPIYFWAYFIISNSPWIIVPAILINSSIKHSTTAFKGIE